MAPKIKRHQEGERVLIAEDSRTQAERLRLVLEEHRYVVQVTSDGREALAAAQADPPDIVVSDVNMPDMDGYDLSRALKSDPNLKDVPVILVTSLSTPQDVMRGLDCGADNFVVKPYDEEFLLTRIRYLLTNSALRGTSHVRTGIEIDLDGKRHFVTAERHQILDLLISTYASAVRLSEEAVRRGEQLRDSYETLAVLHHCAENLNRLRMESDVLAEVVKRLHDLHFVRAGWIWLVDERGAVVTLESAGLGDDQIKALSSSVVCKCRRDFQRGELTAASNIEACDHFAGLNAPRELKSGHASVPLLGEQRILGLLNVIHRDARPFTQEELRVVSALGNQGASALERAQLHATLERKVEERTAQLRASQEHLARVQRITKIGSTEVNLKTQEVVWSDEVYRLLGLDPKQASPSVEAFAIAVHPEDRDRVRELSLRGRQGESVEPIEFRVVELGGNVRWFMRQSEFTRDVAGEPISLIATMYETTQLKRIEAELRENQERLRRSQEHLALAQRVGNIGSAEVDLRTGEGLWTEQSFRIYGLAPANGPLDYEFVMSMTHPDDRDAHRQQSVRARDGVETEPWDYRIVRRNGDIRWVRRKSAIVGWDENGHPTTMLVTHQDVTAIKQAESERIALEAQLTQSQKMEAVGNLTGGIAHDFNNILAVAIGNLDLLKVHVEEGSESDTLVETAINACLKGSELTKSLLAFSRRQPLQPKRVIINKLLHDSVKMLSRAIGETIEVELKLGDELWDVQIDPAQLESALLNMMVNARDAMPDGGLIIIQTRNTTLDQAYAAQHTEVVPGEYVVLEVSDTGHGMPPEVVSRVFEPFFTTKEKGKGTGLGLAMVFGFVKQSGGHIKVYSEVGHGTTIRLYLPRAIADGINAPVDGADIGARAPARNELIMVVEDNPAVRRTVVKQLTHAGYRVVDAESGARAIELIESNKSVDLVFSDVVMPGRITGPELAHEINRRWPKMKVLLTSGFPEGLVANGSKLPAGINLLSKPYRTEELLRRLRDVLDA